MMNEPTLVSVLAAAALVAGCGGAPGDGGEPRDGPSSEESAPAPAPTADAPATIAGLQALFNARSYAGWRAEPDFHPSRGPHGGEVRVFYGPLAAASLDEGQAAFPAGAATVKEERSSGQLMGWSAWVKASPDSAGGRGFFWYEILGSQTYGGDLGSGLCTGCHSSGHDFLLSSR